MENVSWFDSIQGGLILLSEHDIVASIISTIDWLYISWLVWLLSPVILSFLLPAILFLWLYLSAMFLHLIRNRREISGMNSEDLFAGAKRILSLAWSGHGRIWHGYEIVGLDKLPDGPALLIYYHGVIPVDIYYLVARMFLEKKRHIRLVGDRFLFKIPGFQILMDVCCVMPGSVQGGVNLMNEGHLLAIAPGGVREALFADGYEIIWGKRSGFAKIAVQAKVPIVPIFTQNCKEAFRTVGFARSILRRFYEWTRLPIVPIYGGLPVKLRTIIGDPIPYNPDLTAEEVASNARHAIQQLINKHQKLPGDILRALLDRFRKLPDVH